MIPVEIGMGLFFLGLLIGGLAVGTAQEETYVEMYERLKREERMRR